MEGILELEKAAHNGSRVRSFNPKQFAAATLVPTTIETPNKMTTINSNNKRDRSSPDIDESNDSSFLSWLRRSGHLIDRTDHRSKGDMLIKHQSKFPRKVQEAIQSAIDNGLPLEKIGDVAYEAMKELLSCGRVEPGTASMRLENKFDTEEQLEIAIRVLPNLLLRRFAVPIRRIRWIEYFEFWVLSCPKSLAFFPLLAELSYELFEECDHENAHYEHNSKRYHQHSLRLLLKPWFASSIPHRFNVEYEKKVDETAVRTLMRLRKKGFIQKDCSKIKEIFSRTTYWRQMEKTVRFLVDWNPALLGPGFFSPRCDPAIWGTNIMDCPEERLKRIRLLFELGMIYYPEKMGFMFGPPPNWEYARFCKNEGNPFFESASLNEIVEDIILKTTGGEVQKVHNLIAAAATDDDISLDALYLLCRLHPAALMTALPYTMSA